MWTADDKYFGTSLIVKLGLAAPRTVVLPYRDYVPGIVLHESLRNLQYPMDWNRIVDMVGGVPVVLKDAHGGGWKEVHIVHSMEELLYRYNTSGLLTMILQEFIQWQEYARCMCLAQKDVHVMRYDPNVRYYSPEHGFSKDLFESIHHATLTICQAFGYDMNTCEFAIRDGAPYAIDFMNPAPDMNVNSLGKIHFDWMVEKMADNMIRLAKSKQETRSRYDWGKLTRQAETPSKNFASKRKPT
jgi:hypothetical protein